MWPLLVSLLVGGVEVAPGTPCVDGRAAQRLATQLPADVTVSLRPASQGAVLVVVTSPGRTSLRREVPAGVSECEGVERVVLTLVRAWRSTSVVSPRTNRGAAVDAGVLEAGGEGLSPPRDGGEGAAARTTEASRAMDAGAVSSSAEQNPSVRAIDAGSTGASAERGSTPRPTEGSGSSSRAIDAGSSASAELGSMRATEGAASGSSSDQRAFSRTIDAGAVSSPAEQASSVRGLEVSGAVSDGGTAGDSSELVTAPDAGTPLRVGVSVLGGVSSGTTADVLPQGLLSLDLVWRWLGVALDVGLSGGVKQAVAPGEVVASWQWLSLSGRAVWSPTERLLLDVQLGARAFRLVAAATGFTMNEPAQTLLSVGGVGSVGASVRLVGPLGVTVRATGVVKPPERFVITNVSQTLDFGALEGAVHAGVFARW